MFHSGSCFFCFCFSKNAFPIVHFSIFVSALRGSLKTTKPTVDFKKVITKIILQWTNSIICVFVTLLDQWGCWLTTGTCTNKQMTVFKQLKGIMITISRLGWLSKQRGNKFSQIAKSIVHLCSSEQSCFWGLLFSKMTEMPTLEHKPRTVLVYLSTVSFSAMLPLHVI